MDIDPELKQETTPLPQLLPLNPDPLAVASSATAQGLGVAQAADPGGMNISTVVSPQDEDSLTLLPEVQATGRPVGSKRPFQRRRRSRACDACRARKTKVR